EYRIKRVYNGESAWVHGLGTLEVDEQGNITKMIGTIQDISERKQLEDRLFQTEKLQAIGQLAGGIAHDFNNQLTGISVYADLLKDELSSNPELARYADGIILATQRASGITSQLLAFARKGKYLSMRIDLHKIIHEVINLIQHVIDKNIVIKQYLKAQKAFIIGDPAQIQNAIMNLAINARDAMPKGGSLIFRTDVVRLDEEYCKTLPYEINPGSYIRLSVSDTGIGIGKEIIGNIFDPFFTTKEPGKGTGMGLAAVFGTVKNHGGIINVYSEPGQGTRMQMSFPLASESVKNGITIHANNKIEKGSAHILLVDDEEFILDSASQMLQSLGYRVSMCRNGDEAIAYYRENWGTVDLVLLDMIMPVMDGKRCFRMMKKINPEIKALLCSGYSMNTKAQTLIDEGVMDFIQKPFSMIDISKKIKEILKINAKT
ncbi:MAG: response regulator, partial [Spirochaetia bacterium]